MNNFWEILGFSLSITIPIFLILVLGVALYRIRLINDNFVDVASKLVFNITLPALLFISISRTNITKNTDFSLALYAVGSVIIVYILLELLASRIIPIKADRGVVIQGAFRSNMGIIGLAYCVNAYGENVFSVASIYLGSVTILFNILSVICLNRSMDAQKSITYTLKSIAKNPLIIAIVAALLSSYLGLHIPSTLHKAGSYFAQMTLPLALICAGASLNFGALKKDMSTALLSAIGKLVVVPSLITLGGYFFGYRGMQLGVLFLMSSAPSASAGYIMVRAMGGNSSLAANVIVLTTIASVFSTSIGVAILSSLHLI
ncbi:putative transporter YfdV [Marinomonas spartinae]|uniref:Putative transporter YfdV n=1 Tax=Marinomonas spartinae TaxID=1792290 RepID=A0A1A8TDZ8_9GAMM|nr:AEC family transporter [Marinomonas spartinae]SBS31440.1 putative transporter YfdV [Marinomonas spartinae]